MAAFDVPYGGDFAFYLSDATAINVANGERVVLATSAVVTYRVQTPDYVDLAGYTWPEAMSYLGPGEYLGVLRDTLPWTPNRTYRLIVTADAGPDQHRIWDIPVHVQPAAAVS